MRPSFAAITFALCTTVWGTEQAQPSEVVWSFEAAGPIAGSPAIDESGRAYFGTITTSQATRETTFHCVDHAGKQVWERLLPDWVGGGATLTESRVYVWCFDGLLYALDKTNGQIIWTFRTTKIAPSLLLAATPCVDSLGNIYYACQDGLLYCIKHDGDRLWYRPLQAGVCSSPLLDERAGRLYVTDMTNTVYAFDLQGTPVWNYTPTQGTPGRALRMFASPALSEAGHLYVGSNDFNLYCLHAGIGRQQWRVDMGSEVRASPVVALDGGVFTVSSKGKMRAYDVDADANRTLRWETQVGGQVYYSTPTVDTDGNLYVCFAPKVEPGGLGVSQISYLNGKTGAALWTTEKLPGYNDGAVVLDRFGDLYFATEGKADHRLYKIRGAGRAVNESGCPTFHGARSLQGRYEQTYRSWLLENYPPDGADPLPDEDADGLSPFLEYALGTNPHEADPEFLALDAFPEPSQKLRLRFRTAKGIRDPWVLQYTPDLLNWLKLAVPPWQTQMEDRGHFWDIEFVPQQAAPSGCYRVSW